jgi:uncharacterized protein YqeY
MGLEEQISENLKASIKARDERRVSCLRMLKTSLKHKQVEKGKSLNDTEIHSVISTLIRRGQEAALEFRKGKREDLARKEEEEVQIFLSYMPQQIGLDEIEKELRSIISELMAKDMKDLGKVMKAAMVRLAGKAPGNRVNEVAKRLLG